MNSNRKLLTVGALAVLAVLFVTVILLSNTLLRGARLDLTQNHLYTLSQGTKNILSSIEEPIHLTLYFSDKAAADSAQPQAATLRSYAPRVREMLGEMAARAGGKLRVDVVDPLPFSEDEDRATGLGLQPLPWGQGGTNVFLGLAGTNSTKGKSVMPVLDPDKETFLEYDVAKMIHELSMPKKPAVGLITSLPMAQGLRRGHAADASGLGDRAAARAAVRGTSADGSVAQEHRQGHQRARGRPSEAAQRRRAVCDRPIRAAWRPSSRVRRSSRRNRRDRCRSEQSAGSHVCRQVLGPAEAVQGLGRRIRREEGRARRAPRTADNDGAGRAPGAPSGDPRLQQARPQSDRHHDGDAREHQCVDRRLLLAGQGGEEHAHAADPDEPRGDDGAGRAYQVPAGPEPAARRLQARRQPAAGRRRPAAGQVRDRVPRAQGRRSPRRGEGKRRNHHWSPIRTC